MKLIKELKSIARAIDFKIQRWNDSNGSKVLWVWPLVWNGDMDLILPCMMGVGGVHDR